jgi:multicomponent Na+:H+ antiporter subunit D
VELILLPLVSFLIAGVTIAVGRWSRGLALLALAVDVVLLARLGTMLHSGGEIALALGGWGRELGIHFVGDRIGMTFASLVLVLDAAVLAYTWRQELRPYFFMLLHLVVGSGFAMVFTEDLFNTYVILELLTLSSFLLVGYGRQPRQIWASLRYLILCSLGMSLFLLGIAVVYHHTGSLAIPAIAARVAEAPHAAWIPLAAALLVSGAAVKAGILVFSLWLPAAHARATPAVSALLSGVVIKMGVVELFRLSEIFPLELTLTVLGLTTGLLGVVYAIQTYDVKRLLAFHTLSQVGYLLVGFGAGGEAARLGALDYAVAHGLFKALLFLAAGEAARAVRSSDVRDLILHRDGIPRGARIALLVGILGIVGLPPFAGFAAKAVLESGIHPTALHAAMALVSVGTATSFAKLLPLLRSRSKTACCAWPQVAAYGLLGGAVLFFLPLSATVIPRSFVSAAWHWPAFLEALAALVAGLTLHRVLLGRRIPLPMRLFRVEEATLVILGSFFLVYGLLRVG